MDHENCGDSGWFVCCSWRGDRQPYRLDCGRPPHRHSNSPPALARWPLVSSGRRSIRLGGRSTRCEHRCGRVSHLGRRLSCHPRSGYEAFAGPEVVGQCGELLLDPAARPLNARSPEGRGTRCLVARDQVHLWRSTGNFHGAARSLSPHAIRGHHQLRVSWKARFHARSRKKASQP